MAFRSSVGKHCLTCLVLLVHGGAGVLSLESHFVLVSLKEETMKNGVWWMVGGGVMTMVLGYFLGREHAKSEIKTTLKRRMPSMPW